MLQVSVFVVQSNLRSIARPHNYAHRLFADRDTVQSLSFRAYHRSDCLLPEVRSVAYLYIGPRLVNGNVFICRVTAEHDCLERSLVCDWHEMVTSVMAADCVSVSELKATRSLSGHTTEHRFDWTTAEFV